ncbi:DNA processing protein [Deinococcus yavapaiensis KR-236]|uniref:DNA processing protein n=2 Tax=Deinococcus TaxID=1298 RepID=A0A318S7Z5_9DEIO|nr:DNA processing protein [Deinococcus yavapaiensis KR-236]
MAFSVGTYGARMPNDSSNDELLALLTLRFTSWLGASRIEALRRHFGSASAALSASPSEWREVKGLDVRALASLGAKEARTAASEEIGKAAKQGVTLLGRGLPTYPDALEALPDPPPIVWVKGDLPTLDVVPKAIGVVGTRTASTFGKGFTRKLALDLAEAGVMVVSGLARGIDTAAHTAAIELGAPTIGVLGSGVDVVYPGENAGLARKMTVVSEHPLGTRPAPHHFPIRNRIIAALGAGSVVVEGSVTSGAMLTASSALECGRTVFAVPGRPNEPLSAGPHKLLREGAVLVERSSDIFEELGWTGGRTRTPPTLPPHLAQVYAALNGPTLLDDLAVELERSVPDVQSALMLLTLEGHVVETPGGRFERA